MGEDLSEIERPVGEKVEILPPGHKPNGRILFGRWTRLERVSVARHARDLYESFDGKDPQSHIWTYLGYGPFKTYESFVSWLTEREASQDPWFYAFIPKTTGKAAGMGSFMRLDAANGVIEIGHIWMTPSLQRTREATDAIFQMMRHAFDELGVRRLEWKCDALNEPSRRAALRFGFAFEGIFRQHFIVKGRNRDTAWFSIIDKEWPPIRERFKAWLKDENFDEQGRQKTPLKIHAIG
jgi:RimJ/RimL family protein N-acetyltransferase